MTKHTLVGLIACGAVGVIISCDNGSPATTSNLAPDCPIGTFHPVGVTDCVFPATDVNNQPLNVSDNRCASGQPAVPPSCVSNSGLRAYLSTSSSCAPGYSFLDGSCDRQNVTGFAGMVGTGVGGAFGEAGTGIGGDFGLAGSTGAAGAAGAAGGAVVGGIDNPGGTAGVDGSGGATGAAGELEDASTPSADASAADDGALPSS